MVTVAVLPGASARPSWMATRSRSAVEPAIPSPSARRCRPARTTVSHLAPAPVPHSCCAASAPAWARRRLPPPALPLLLAAPPGARSVTLCTSMFLALSSRQAGPPARPLSRTARSMLTVPSKAAPGAAAVEYSYSVASLRSRLAV